MYSLISLWTKWKSAVKKSVQEVKDTASTLSKFFFMANLKEKFWWNIEKHVSFLHKIIFEPAKVVEPILTYVNINDFWRVSCSKTFYSLNLVEWKSLDFGCTGRSLQSVCVWN